jgi:hypothetical protein
VCVSPLKCQNQSQNHLAEFNGVIYNPGSKSTNVTNDTKGNSFQNLFYNYNLYPIFPSLDKYFSDLFEHVFSLIGPTGAEIWPFKGFKSFNDCGISGGDTIHSNKQTGLMSIWTRSLTKHDKDKGKASFKHSIGWHLREIKRPKNLVIFC